MMGYGKLAKRVIWFSWRNWAIKALFQGLRSCTTGTALSWRAESCTARTATCDDSFNVKIPISGNGRGNKFCHEGARCGGLRHRSLM